MILNIKKNKSLRKSEIIGIFDLDSSTISVYTRSFLKNSEKKGIIENIDDLPKSFVLTNTNIECSIRKIKNYKTTRNYRGNSKIYFSKKTVKSIIQIYKNKDCEGKIN